MAALDSSASTAAVTVACCAKMASGLQFTRCPHALSSSGGRSSGDWSSRCATSQFVVSPPRSAVSAGNRAKTARGLRSMMHWHALASSGGRASGDWSSRCATSQFAVSSPWRAASAGNRARVAWCPRGAAGFGC